MPLGIANLPAPRTATSADIVVGRAQGKPQVKIFDGVSGDEVDSFFAYDPAFTGGVFVGGS